MAWFDSEQCYYGENWMLITQVSRINIVTLFIVSSSERNLWDCHEWAVVINFDLSVGSNNSLANNLFYCENINVGILIH